MEEHKPTDEQQEAIDVARKGSDMAIEAFAGAGKTSTLKMVGNALEGVGQYIAFNKAIATDAATKFPEHVACRTAHSLAMGAVGHRYRHRLNSQRLWNRDIADLLGIDPIDVPMDGGGRKRLSKSRLAGIVMRGVGAFCLTADPKPLSRHLPYIDGIDTTFMGKRTYANNDLVRDELYGHLIDAWRDICDIDGRLPFTHNHYLKMWELNGPRIEADFILHDESQDCQPPGTLVRLPSGREVPIETINVGDKVMSYTMKSLDLNDRFGSRVGGVLTKAFYGDLVTVATDRRLTEYTPNHECIVKIGPAMHSKHVLYLMRQGDRWRIGVTSTYHGSRLGSSGVQGRLREEKGDALWVLDVFDNREDALVAEALGSYEHRIPQAIFKADRFWNKWDPSFASPEALLARYGRDVNYPLITSDRRYLLYARATVVRACNLLDGMLALDAEHFQTLGGRGNRPEAWHPIRVGRRLYHGPVHSLAVEGSHTYVGDGLVTHNCNGAMMSIVQQQKGRAQLIWVGDRYQQIMGWNGAVNAMERVEVDERTWLTQSFRFGPEIASVANLALADLEAEKMVRGSGPEGYVGYVEMPSASLFRTNAGAVEAALRYLKIGRKVHLVGGAGEIVTFAKAALELQTTGNTEHANLFAFGSWPEVQDYVKSDEGGDDNDLKKLVKLIDGHGAKEIMDALGACSDEKSADTILSTAHKSKGREWDSVRLGPDFPTEQNGPLDEEEIRLLYVAATRAKTALDPTLCPYFTKG